MTSKTCSLCGIVFETNGEFCATCLALMAGPLPAAPPVFESNSDQTYYPEPAFQQSFNQTFQPAAGDFSQPVRTTDDYFESNYQPNSAFESTYQAQAGFDASDQSTDNYQPNENYQSQHQPAGDFPPAADAPRFTPPRSQPAEKPPEPEYKPSFWNWLTELPTFVKVGGGVLIFAVIFAVVLKSFMHLDVSVTSSAELEPQKPWHWSLFGSNPSAEAILDKHENATNAKNKDVVKETFTMSGRGQFLRMPSGGFDHTAIRKDPEALFKPFEDPKQAGKPKPPHIVNNPRLPDFDVTFDISLKNPGKMLVQLLLKPKAGFTQSFVTYRTAGFNGQEGWNFNRTVINGTGNLVDTPNKPNLFFFNRTNDGISLAIQRSMFAKLEFKGLDVIQKRRVYNVETTSPLGEKTSIYFDIETGLATKINKKGVEFEIVDYGNHEGVMYPSKILYKIDGDWLFLIVDKFQSDSALNDSIFERSSYR